MKLEDVNSTLDLIVIIYAFSFYASNAYLNSIKKYEG